MIRESAGGTLGFVPEAVKLVKGHLADIQAPGAGKLFQTRKTAVKLGIGFAEGGFQVDALTPSIVSQGKEDVPELL